VISASPVSIGGRVGQLAAAHPDKRALTCASSSGEESSLTWSELDDRSNQIAHGLLGQGIGPGELVAVGFPAGLDHVVCVVGAWKVGACVLPLNAALPTAERDELLEVAQPKAVFGMWADRLEAITSLKGFAGLPTSAVPDTVPVPGRAIASGGSTGRSKVIVDPNRLEAPRGAYSSQLSAMGVRAGHTILIACPLYHNFGNGWLMMSLFEGFEIVFMERFSADLAANLIERHRVTYMPLVPTMMQRILRLPDLERRDLSSLEGILHTGAPCPEWVKRGWIELIGPNAVYEVYGATEAVGACLIRGDDWLRRPGSVGQPFHTQILILDESGTRVPPSSSARSTPVRTASFRPRTAAGTPIATWEQNRARPLQTALPAWAIWVGLMTMGTSISPIDEPT